MEYTKKLCLATVGTTGKQGIIYANKVYIHGEQRTERGRGVEREGQVCVLPQSHRSTGDRAGKRLCSHRRERRDRK